jgi:hypothetical protein
MLQVWGGLENRGGKNRCERRWEDPRRVLRQFDRPGLERRSVDCSFDVVLARLVSRSGRHNRSRLGGADVDHFQDQRSYVILNTGS